MAASGIETQLNDGEIAFCQILAAERENLYRFVKFGFK